MDGVLASVRISILDAVRHMPVNGIATFEPILPHPSQLGPTDSEVAESPKGLDVTSVPVTVVFLIHLTMDQDIPGEKADLGLHIEAFVNLSVVRELDFASNGTVAGQLVMT